MSKPRPLPPLPQPLPEGAARWCRATSAPLPTMAEILEAQRSPEERRRVDLMYAAACGFEGAAAEEFVARLALADVRREIGLEEEAIAKLESARKRRVEAETRGDLERLRGQGVVRATRRMPRSKPASRDAA